MRETNIKSKVFSSLFWVFMNRVGNQIVQFIIQIILARLLLPREYGLIAIVLVFIQIANVFIDSGFNTALIQKKDADELDFSSVFLISFLLALALYLVIFFFAPIISSYYNEPNLTSIIRVLSLVLFIGVYGSIQTAIISRNLWFRKTFLSSFTATLLSGIIAIVAAYNNLGVWALVMQQLLAKLLSVIILSFQIKWVPSIKFSIRRIKSLFNFGSKLLLSSFLDTVYNNISTLIIGKMYTTDMLAYYNKGKQFPSLVVSEINGSIQLVMFPVFSTFQENKKKVKSMLQRSIRTSTFLVFPMMVGLGVLAEPIIRLLLTDKWIDSLPFLQIFCFIFALWPIHTSNLQAINAMGRSDIFLKLEVIKKSIGAVVLSISVFYGIYGIIVGNIITSILGIFINSFPNKKLIDYNYQELFADIFPSLLISVIMGIIVYFTRFSNLELLTQIIFKVLIGVTSYIVLSIVFKVESFYYLFNAIFDFLKSRFNQFSKEGK